MTSVPTLVICSYRCPEVPDLAGAPCEAEAGRSVWNVFPDQSEYVQLDGFRVLHRGVFDFIVVGPEPCSTVRKALKAGLGYTVFLQ